MRFLGAPTLFSFWGAPTLFLQKHFHNVFLPNHGCKSSYKSRNSYFFKIPPKISYFFLLFNNSIIHWKHAGIAISGHLEGLKSSKFSGAPPLNPVGGGGLTAPPKPSCWLPRSIRSLDSLGSPSLRSVDTRENSYVEGAPTLNFPRGPHCVCYAPITKTYSKYYPTLNFI